MTSNLGDRPPARESGWQSEGDSGGCGDGASTSSAARTRGSLNSATGTASESGSENSFSGRQRIMPMSIPPPIRIPSERTTSAEPSPRASHRDIMSIARLTDDQSPDVVSDVPAPRRLSQSMPDAGMMPSYAGVSAQMAPIRRESTPIHDSRRSSREREQHRFSPMSRTTDSPSLEHSQGLRSALYGSPSQAPVTLPTLSRMTAFEPARTLPPLSAPLERARAGGSLTCAENLRLLPRPDMLSRPPQISPPMTSSPKSANFKVPEDQGSGGFKVPPLQTANPVTDAQMQAAGFTSSAPLTPLPSASSGTFSSRSSKDSGTGGLPPAFRLVCRQQPQHARMCGFGEKDRRPLDPPPVLEVLQIDRNGQPMGRVSRDSLLTVHVTLWDESGTRERSLLVSQAATPRRKSGSGIDSTMQDAPPALPPAHTVPEVPVFSQASARGDRLTRVLMGSLVANPSYLKDEHDRDCALFILPDLSVRTEGKYRLRFSLFRLELSDLLSPGARSNVLAECMTDVFTVYPAKTFPGMLKSTELTRAIARQGFKVQIRNDVRPKKNSGSAPTATGSSLLGNSSAASTKRDDDTAMTDQ